MSGTRLADAVSPYLRSHAGNPVDWYPWGDEAFAIDVKSVSVHPLSGNGENRDTALLTDVKKDGEDRYADEYLGELACTFRHEKRHARLFEATSFA